MGESAKKSSALWVLRKIRDAGYDAVFAGGCVRDMRLGLPCKDYDIATNATPPQICQIFRRVLLVGAQFGVAVVVHRGDPIEVATYRSDVSYSDGRHPDAVHFSSREEDAKRRDFTINGMFYDPISREVIDYVGGQADLKAGIIRTIGCAEDRFSEDYLRMVRAVRFTVRLGFTLEPKTAQAIRHAAGRITGISGERIFDELGKMLSRKSAADALKLLADLNLAQSILPELFEDESLWREAVYRVEQLARYRDVNLNFAAILLELSAAAQRKILRRWGAPNALRDELAYYSRYRDAWQEAGEWPLCEFKRLMGVTHFESLRRIWRMREKSATGREMNCFRLARRARAIDPRQIAPASLVSGEVLKEMGLSEGPQLGKVLKLLYDAQLNEEIKTVAQARKKAKELLSER
jgi:tRNA nucleotidyltransferase/poly(A) polymerase